MTKKPASAHIGFTAYHLHTESIALSQLPLRGCGFLKKAISLKSRNRRLAPSSRSQFQKNVSGNYSGHPMKLMIVAFGKDFLFRKIIARD